MIDKTNKVYQKKPVADDRKNRRTLRRLQVEQHHRQGSLLQPVRLRLDQRHPHAAELPQGPNQVTFTVF
jgi:hypothetical protein